VKIENRFGDVYTGDMSSDIKLSLFYGDLKAGNLSGICDISISAGNAEIENYHEGQVSVLFHH
jgi:hypothetical protein